MCDPPAVLAERREKARTAVEGKPVSRAAVVVAVWILLAAPAVPLVVW